MELLASLFSKALKLESPWEITKIEFTEAEGKIKVYIDTYPFKILKRILRRKNVHCNF